MKISNIKLILLLLLINQCNIVKIMPKSNRSYERLKNSTSIEKLSPNKENLKYNQTKLAFRISKDDSTDELDEPIESSGVKSQDESGNKISTKFSLAAILGGLVLTASELIINSLKLKKKLKFSQLLCTIRKSYINLLFCDEIEENFDSKINEKLNKLYLRILGIPLIIDADEINFMVDETRKALFSLGYVSSRGVISYLKDEKKFQPIFELDSEEVLSRILNDYVNKENRGTETIIYYSKKINEDKSLSFHLIPSLENFSKQVQLLHKYRNFFLKHSGSLFLEPYGFLPLNYIIVTEDVRGLNLTEIPDFHHYNEIFYQSLVTFLIRMFTEFEKEKIIITEFCAEDIYLVNYDEKINSFNFLLGYFGNIRVKNNRNDSFPVILSIQVFEEMKKKALKAIFKAGFFKLPCFEDILNIRHDIIFCTKPFENIENIESIENFEDQSNFNFNFNYKKSRFINSLRTLKINFQKPILKNITKVSSTIEKFLELIQEKDPLLELSDSNLLNESKIAFGLFLNILISDDRVKDTSELFRTISESKFQNIGLSTHVIITKLEFLFSSIDLSSIEEEREIFIEVFNLLKKLDMPRFQNWLNSLIFNTKNWLDLLN